MSTVHNTKQMCETIYHDAVNFSTAQSKYSFSKDRRFAPGITGVHTDFTQNLTSTLGRRSPSFGIGDRFTSPKSGCK